MSVVSNTEHPRTVGGKPVQVSVRPADIWRAPLTDLPVRDELVRQFVPLSAEMHLLEAGPGSGFLSFLLARVVRRLTLLEVAADSAAGLKRYFAAQPNVGIVVDDLCRAGLGVQLGPHFDGVICIEVFEFLSDPATALCNLAQVLKPGGSLYLQFPNYEAADWPTFYRTRQQLDAQLRAAGFAGWEVYSLHLSPWAQRLFSAMHEAPLRWYRARQAKRQQRPQSPQQYDQTWAHRHGGRLESLKLLIHLYWMLTMFLMKLGGEVFRRDPCGEDIFRKNLFVVATAPEKETRTNE